MGFFLNTFRIYRKTAYSEECLVEVIFFDDQKRLARGAEAASPPQSRSPERHVKGQLRMISASGKRHVFIILENPLSPFMAVRGRGVLLKSIENLRFRAALDSGGAFVSSTGSELSAIGGSCWRKFGECCSSRSTDSLLIQRASEDQHLWGCLGWVFSVRAVGFSL